MTPAPYTQSIQNSLPSMSSIGMHESLPSYSVCTCTAPSGTSRAHSASSAARRSLPTSPVPTRTSRCTRFLTAFPSGTRWKYSRGPTPEGSMQANHESRCSGDCERWKSSQVANPSGGGGTTYPNTSHQKRARRSGSAQSKVTWNFLIADIGAPYQGDLGLCRSFPQGDPPATPSRPGPPWTPSDQTGRSTRTTPGGGAHRWPQDAALANRPPAKDQLRDNPQAVLTTSATISRRLTAPTPLTWPRARWAFPGPALPCPAPCPCSSPDRFLAWSRSMNQIDGSQSGNTPSVIGVFC